LGGWISKGRAHAARHVPTFYISCNHAMYRVPRPVLAQYKKNIVCCGMVLELRVRAICELARPRGRGRARVRSVGRRNDPYIEES
jgi:hypothetical protein